MPRNSNFHPDLPANGRRILSLDLARGLIVLIMPAVHVVILYSKPEVKQSVYGVILQFLAEGPGAQLFMFLMGVSISLSKNKSPKKIFKRTFYLLAGAYLLNLFKFCIPYELGMIPTPLIEELNFDSLDFLLLGDIFHFAAIAYLVTYFISRLNRNWALIIAIAIMLISPLVWDVKTNLIFVNRVLEYFTGHPPHIFFPVFPWLIYPLAGVWASSFIQSRKLGLAGLTALIISLLLPATTVIDPYPGFYRTRPADSLFHLAIVFLWISSFNYFSRKIKFNYFFRLLNFCSRHITSIYIIQWLIIFWLLPIAGYQLLGINESILWSLGMTATILILTKLFVHVTQQKNL